MRHQLIVFAMLSLAGCSRGDGDGAPVASPAPGDGPHISDIAAGYTAYRLMTDGPVEADPAITALRIGVTPVRVTADPAAFGPHAGAAVRIFMNDLAADAFERKVAPYPVGAVIVKEKTRIDPRPATAVPSPTAPSHDGVGGMVKRPPGYDPRHGDWEYFYFDDPARVETGRLPSCVACHAGARGTDHVFGGWSADAGG